MEVKVLKGGLDPSNPDRYKFISGEVTNTRLMGVVAMHLEFEDTILKDAPHFHQFYYFDYEELGLETLRFLYSNNAAEIRIATIECFAGLGAEPVSITEEEAYLFAAFMVQDTKKKQEPLPGQVKEIRFAVDKGEALLSDSNLWDSLNMKMCVSIKSDYGIVNYFLMRIFGLDFDAASFLSTLPKDQLENIYGLTHCTFLRNKIESVAQSVGEHRYYKTESLVELEKEERHYLIVSEVELKNRKVIRVNEVSRQKISAYEASLLLSKEEFVSVFDFEDDVSLFNIADEYIESLKKISLGMTQNEHINGTMFMNFKSNNDHAENKIFNLSDDLNSVLFITSIGQIVIASFDVAGIIDTEARIVLSGLGDKLKPTGRYSFPTSIIYDFAESGFDDFNEFLGQLE